MTTFVSDRNALMSALPKGGVVAEVGVFRGEFSRVIFDTVQPEKLLLIDPWSVDLNWMIGGEKKLVTGGEAKENVEWEFEREIADGRVELLEGRSIDVLPLLGNLNGVYVDAEHDYDSVIIDLELAIRRVVKGGWISGHDYCAIFNWGVPRAVESFVRRHDLQIDYLTEQERGRCCKRSGVNACLPSELSYNSYGVLIP